MKRSVYTPASRILCGFLALLMCTGFPYLPPSAAWAQPAENKQAKQLIDDGIGAYQQGQYEEAITKLTQARTLLPSHSPTALYLGLAYLKQNKTTEAIAAWREYVTLQPYTEKERKENLPQTIPQYLTVLLREENHRTAQEAIAREQMLGTGNPQTVAITYYRNLGSPQLLPLQKGLTALLISDVSQVPDLKVVERDRLQALLEELRLGTTGLVDQKTAPKVGRLLGAGKVATGTYLDTAQDQLRVDSVLAESTAARVLSTQEGSGKLQQFHELEKGLALAILRDLGYDEQRLQATGVLDKIRRPHTTSLVAFTSYSHGLDAKDRGDYPTARGQFDQALTTDPNFEEARRERDALPVVALTVAQIIAALEAGGPSSSAATAGLAGAGWGISGTVIAVAVVVTTVVVVVGVTLGLALSDDDDKRNQSSQFQSESSCVVCSNLGSLL